MSNYQNAIEVLEAIYYVVSIVAFPLAIWVFVQEQRRSREEAEEARRQEAERALTVTTLRFKDYLNRIID